VAAAAPAFRGSGRTALLVTDPVRSGQRIYAEGADLIVTATVNPGCGWPCLTIAALFTEVGRDLAAGPALARGPVLRPGT
jgi:hypothetical protein